MTKRWLTIGALLAAAGCAVAQDQGANGAAKPGAGAQVQSAPAGASAGEQQLRPDYLPRLMVGDRAPALSIDTFVKGSPVTGFEKGRAYVVEFWATWCLPCRESMPHLTKLQGTYKDRGLTVIGISSSEQNGLEDVVPFVEKMGDAMGYTIAWDDKGKTDGAWRKAAMQTSIPTAFVVDKNGRIAWIGHPTFPAGEMDEVIGAVIAGTFDTDDAADRERGAMEMMHRAQVLWSEGEQRLALDVLGGMVTLNPDRFAPAAMQKFQGLLVHLNDADAAYDWAEELMEGFYKNNPAVLVELAWTILEAPGVEDRNFDLAMQAAKQAEAVTGGKDASVIDTLARVHFAQGRFAEARDLQARALELVTDERMKDVVRGRLEQYQQAAVETK